MTTLVTIASIAVVAFVAVAALKMLGVLNSGEGREYPLSADGYDEPLAHIVLPNGWAGAQDPDSSTFDVRSPNDALHATVEIVRSSYDRTFSEHVSQHPTSSPTRWELLGSTLPLVHVDMQNCVYAVVQASFDVSVVINSCVDEGHELETYRPAIGKLLEGVRP